MIKHIIKLMFFALIIMNSNIVSANEYRTFHDKNDREIQALILGFEPHINKVEIQLRNGRISKADLAVFSSIDQIYIKDWYASEVRLSTKNLIVTINKKVVLADRYHEVRDGWRSHHPGMDFEDVAFEIKIDNRTPEIMEGLQVEYCIFYESHCKEKTGTSELEEMSDGSKSWHSVKSSNFKKHIYQLTEFGDFSVQELASKKNCENLTKEVRIRDGKESKYGTTRRDTRDYKMREVRDKVSGVIIRLSLPLPSGNFARKGYSYPKGFIDKQDVNWPVHN